MKPQQRERILERWTLTSSFVIVVGYIYHLSFITQIGDSKEFLGFFLGFKRVSKESKKHDLSWTKGNEST